MTTSRPIWLIAAPLLFLILWSGGYVVAKIGLQYAEPLTLLAIRFALVVVAMAGLFAILRPPVPQKASEWGQLALVGFLIQSVYFGFCYLAFTDGVASGTVALIMSLQPILVAIAAPRMTSERVSLVRWGGLGLALLGTSLVIVARLEIAAPTIAGFIFCAAGLLGMTSGSLVEKVSGRAHHPVTANLVGFVAGLAGVLPLALLLEDQHIDLTWEFGAALGYLVIGNSIIATSLLLAMIRVGEVARVSALLFLVPPVASLMAWLALGEIMPPLAWLGLATAGVGFLIATRRSKRGDPSVAAPEKARQPGTSRTR